MLDPQGQMIDLLIQNNLCERLFYRIYHFRAHKWIVDLLNFFCLLTNQVQNPLDQAWWGSSTSPVTLTDWE